MNKLEKHAFDSTKTVARSIGIPEEDVKAATVLISRHAKKRMPDAERAGRVFREMIEKKRRIKY